MNRRLFASMLGVAVVLVTAFMASSGPAVGQDRSSSPGTASTSNPAYTPWGDPDLQGVWTMAETGTPMERPAELGERQFLTEQEIAARVAAASRETVDPGGPRDPRTAEAARPSEQGIYGQEYNRFWMGTGPRRVKPWSRTSLVIDPPDGRLPVLTAAAVKRLEDRLAARKHRSEADSWVDRSVAERCLTSALVKVTTAKRILQAPGWVAIVNMDQFKSDDAQIVPLDGRPPVADNVRTWVGASHGRWEGSTLVVETHRVNDRQDGGPIMPKRRSLGGGALGGYLGSGATLRLIERFTRVEADTIEYQYTVDDPAVYARPYTVLRPMERQPGDYLHLEGSCLEGNYAMAGQLSAARADEKYAMQAAAEEWAATAEEVKELRRRTEAWLKATQERGPDTRQPATTDR